MIKKLLLLATAPFIGITMVAAQCTPDYQGTTAGLDPDSLPHAEVGQAYYEVIQMLVPSDTMITEFNGQPLSQPLQAEVNYVDLIQLDLGVLSTYGFSYATVSQDPNGDNTHFPGGTEGCVLFNAPSSNTAPKGTYPVTIYVTYNVDIPGLNIYNYPSNDTITDYKLVVEEAAGIFSIVKTNNFELLQNSPNPFSGTTKIEFISTNTQSYVFEVTNLLGEVVYSQSITSRKGLNSIVFDASSFTKGMYTYSLGNSAGVKDVKVMTIN